MKAIGYRVPGAPDVLQLIDLPETPVRERDLRVEIQAVGINPADPKIRSSLALQGDGPQVLGFDAAGVVRETGPGVRWFSTGDVVYYAGDVTRLGANATDQVVDERIVGRAPRNLSAVEAAALRRSARMSSSTIGGTSLRKPTAPKSRASMPPSPSTAPIITSAP